MRAGLSPAGQALRRAQAAAARARLLGCGVDEAAGVLAGEHAAGALAGEHAAARPRPAVLGRRQVLGSAGATALAVSVPAMRPAVAGRTSAHAPRVVIIGSGIAGLGCAYRLWQRHGIRSEVYEYNARRPGGRIVTIRDFFGEGQYAEGHGEFISSEHTAMRQLAARLGLPLDNVNAYPPHTRPADYRLSFGGSSWPQQALNKDWHEWGYALFHDAAFRKAPWPTLHDKHSAHALRWDHMPATEWIEQNIPGGLSSDFGQLCVSILLDEFGGPVGQQSALNLIYLLGFYDSSPSGSQPKGSPQLSGTDEKWHVRGGNDAMVSRLVAALPPGTVRLGEELVAVRERGHARYACTFARGRAVHDVVADHVVLALPFTKLREVDLHGVGLPAIQWRAIRHQPLGSNSKIAMQFSRRVWNAEHWTGTFYTGALAQCCPRTSVRGQHCRCLLTQSGWETTVDQAGKAGIMIALPGGETGADLGRRYHLRTYHGPAPDALAQDYLAAFEQEFPGCRAAFTGKAYYVWSSGDPHIGGAYSYLKPGQYTAFNGAQGRRHANLHFAGEHTSVNFQGFMEGALRSGYRCATEITGRR